MSMTVPFEKYPSDLENWKEQKKKLWFQGDLSLLDLKKVSIIGTRKPSTAGIIWTEKITKLVIENDFCVVSGMAKGIDTAAHQETLKQNGKTIAVMGTDIDGCYPKENFNLKQNIKNHGLILSQFHPGTSTSRFNFPKRNKLMAELSFACIVVEAGENSGTRYQTEEAKKLKKEVAFLSSLVEKKYRWISDFLQDFEAFIIKDDLSNFQDWLRKLDNKEKKNYKENHQEKQIELMLSF